MIERRGFEMAYFYSFIRGLAVFFILLQVIIGILPGEKYGKYMRMIIGIFILSYITYFLRNWDIQKDLTNFDKITNIYEEKLMEVEKDYEEYEITKGRIRFGWEQHGKGNEKYYIMECEVITGSSFYVITVCYLKPEEREGIVELLHRIATN